MVHSALVVVVERVSVGPQHLTIGSDFADLTAFDPGQIWNRSLAASRARGSHGSPEPYMPMLTTGASPKKIAYTDRHTPVTVPMGAAYRRA